LNIDLSALPQSRAYKALRPGRTVCTPWGRGGGKSAFLRIKSYLLVAEWEWRVRPGASSRGVRIVVLMPSLTQARKVHQQCLIDELEGDGAWAWLHGSINRTELRITFPGGSWIQFVSQEAAQGARGIRCDFVATDEADDVEMALHDAIVVPWFTEPHSLRMELISGTPKRGRYGLLYRTHQRGTGKELTADGQPFTDHSSFHATSYDFPKWVDARAIEKARLGTPSTVFAREWLCDFDAAEGLVYYNFVEDFHVRPRDPRIVFHTYVAGVDWGFRDPTVIIVLGITGSGRDAQVHAVHETYVHDVTDSEVAEIVKRIDFRFPNCMYYADPSRPQAIAACRKGARVRMVAADNAIEDGIACVMDALHVHTTKSGEEWSKLTIDPSCTNLIREFGLYRHKRDPRDNERVVEAIEGKHDHCFAAGTMVETSAGPVAIESITVDSMVWTRIGLRKVIAAGPTRVATLWRLDMTNGRSIDGTPDHKIMTTERGWVRLDELIPSDTLIGCTVRASLQNQRSQRSTGADSAATQTLRDSTSTQELSHVPVGVAGVWPLQRDGIVYCLTVEGQHEFYANGILVANCLDSIRYAFLSHFGRPESRITTGYGHG